MSFIVVYVTHGTMDAAQKVAGILLEKKLIACANFFPITSSFWWKGALESGEEVVSLLKTASENWDVVRGEIEMVHEYEVPCIIKFDVNANENYEAWIHRETTRQR